MLTLRKRAGLVMRYVAVVWTLWLFAAAPAVSPTMAQDLPRLGPIKLGMSPDQVRSALPNAKWGPAYQGIAARDALSIGGEAFDVEYQDQSWDRYRLNVTRRTVGLDRGKCLERALRFFTEIENANGPLAAYPLAIDYQDVREVKTFGKASQATLLTQTEHGRPQSTGFHLAAHQTRGAVAIRAIGIFQVSNTVGQQDSCSYSAVLEALPPRPAQGTVPFDALDVSLVMSIGALHHSLDGTPQIPPNGIEVEVQCVVPDVHPDFPGKFYDCAAAPGANASPFAPAGMRRASEMRVKTRRTRDGRWTSGELTRPRVRLLPAERRTVGPIDTSKSRLLRVVAGQSSGRIPQKIADRLPKGSSATVEAGCVVQSDGSLICPELRVKATSHDADFAAAALAALMQMRFETTLSNGEATAGIGYRTTFEYQIR